MINRKFTILISFFLILVLLTGCFILGVEDDVADGEYDEGTDEPSKAATVSINPSSTGTVTVVTGDGGPPPEGLKIELPEMFYAEYSGNNENNSVFWSTWYWNGTYKIEAYPTWGGDRAVEIFNPDGKNGYYRYIQDSEGNISMTPKDKGFDKKYFELFGYPNGKDSEIPFLFRPTEKAFPDDKWSYNGKDQNGNPRYILSGDTKIYCDAFIAICPDSNMIKYGTYLYENYRFIYSMTNFSPDPGDMELVITVSPQLIVEYD